MDTTGLSVVLIAMAISEARQFVDWGVFPNKIVFCLNLKKIHYSKQHIPNVLNWKTPIYLISETRRTVTTIKSHSANDPIKSP
jgi:hypothetical protein